MATGSHEEHSSTLISHKNLSGTAPLLDKGRWANK